MTTTSVERGPQQIVCVTTEHPHRHIVSVGIGGWAATPTRKLSVARVRAAIAAGQTFFTYSQSTQQAALVHAATCDKEGCTVETLRSAADAVWDNDLDSLAACPVSIGRH